MKILILTVAGEATRFFQSGGTDLKCLYYTEKIEDSLLYRMLHQSCEIDKYIIVGGYQYEHLCQVLEKCFSEFSEKLIVINNENFSTYGSGYSLYKGLDAAMQYEFDELIFAEGDLYIDQESYTKIKEADSDVLTINHEPIFANKAVALYMNVEQKVNYIYDTRHGSLEIKEPFTCIFNSGQVWKFANPERIRKIYQGLSEKEWQGTNLVYIQKYFEELLPDEYQIIDFKKWINCNTVEDYEKIKVLEANNEGIK